MNKELINIRKVEEKDYEELVKLLYQSHELHYEYRPDIYVDGNPLSRENFEFYFRRR